MKKKKRPYARKRFGQHFLQDENVIDRIISSAEIKDDDHVIEIGPGRGALTRRLLGFGVKVTVVEIDRDLAEDLRNEYSNNPNFRLIEADILKTDWDEIIGENTRNKIIANLPYNISTPLLFQLIKVRQFFDSMTIMLQKEVALRICHDGTGKKVKDYGALSVASRIVFNAEVLFLVSPKCFYPAPKVDSAVIQLSPKPKAVDNESDFFQFVRDAFNSRRKLLSTHLKNREARIYNQMSKDELESIQGLRPENLLPGQYLNLFKFGRLVGDD